MVDGIGIICDGTQQEFELMDYAVGGLHDSLGEITMEEFGYVG